MPVNVVKNKADEKKWAKAKRMAKKAFGSAEGHWGFVMSNFKKMKKKKTKLKERKFDKLYRKILTEAKKT
jgi:hypothetical protein